MTSNGEKPPSKRGGYRLGAGRKPTTPDDEDRLRIGLMCEQQFQTQLKCLKADWELNSLEPLRLLTDAANAIPVSERAASLQISLQNAQTRLAIPSYFVADGAIPHARPPQAKWLSGVRRAVADWSGLEMTYS